MSKSDEDTDRQGNTLNSSVQGWLGLMQWSIEKQVSSGFAAALISLSVMGGLAYWSINRLIQTAHWVEHTHLVITDLESILADFSSIEAGQRGYLITDNQQYLAPYYRSTAAIQGTVDELRWLTRDNAAQQQRLAALQPALEQRLTLLNAVLEAHQQGGLPAAQRLIARDAGRQLTQEIQQLIHAMLEEEQRLLVLRSQESKQTARTTLAVAGLGGVLAFVLVPFGGWTINRDLTRRRQAEAQLQESEQRLKQWVDELEQRRSEILQLGHLSDVLQACFTLEEAYTVLAELVQPLFPESAGGVKLINESKVLVEAVATWGDPPLRAELFGPSECWAIRRGRPYFLPDGHSALRCQHLRPPLPVQSLCVPMTAQGEALGILHLVTREAGHLSPAKQQLATTVAEHIAVALANLKLRQTLKNQSIRDPLTGLFNRRYLEESLQRELVRAERSEQPLSIILLDVDHFKRFNDTQGHEAGDIVLREVGQFLQGMIRGSDIGCRYGREEFLLMLPEASAEIAQ